MIVIGPAHSGAGGHGDTVLDDTAFELRKGVGVGDTTVLPVFSSVRRLNEALEAPSRGWRCRWCRAVGGNVYSGMRRRLPSVKITSRIVKKMILAAPAALALAACGTAATPASTAALTASTQSLTCRAYMSTTRPADNTTTVLRVRTQASVKVFSVAFSKTVDRAYFVRASTSGRARIAYHVSGATPGRMVDVAVTVVREHSASSCSTSFTPRRPGSPSSPHSPSPPPSSSAPRPTPSHSLPAPRPSSPSPAGCYPRTSGGNCYEPGEYCSDADHGMHGVAGDGKAIICENNDGWRWEPA